VVGLCPRKYQVLETNLYPIATENARKLNKLFKKGDYDKCTAVLKVLLECISPKVIIAHGKKSCTLIQDLVEPDKTVVIP
jgi:hypothetical protein